LGSSFTDLAVAVDAYFVALNDSFLVFGGSFFELSCLIPLFSDLLFPILVGLDFPDSILNDCKCLSDFEILHVFVIVKIVGKLEKLIYLCLFVFLLLLLGSCPSWLLRLFRRFY
jgi:hypothetical protein